MVSSEDSSGINYSLLQLSELRAKISAEVDSTLISQVQALSPIALAYVGDAVYELFVRGALLFPPHRPNVYHHRVVEQVRAEQQALQLANLQVYLTPAEHDILRKGRNASPRGPKRVDPQIYQQATSFETLIGYLYLTDLPRLIELLGRLSLASSPS